MQHQLAVAATAINGTIGICRQNAISGYTDSPIAYQTELLRLFNLRYK